MSENPQNPSICHIKVSYHEIGGVLLDLARVEGDIRLQLTHDQAVRLRDSINQAVERSEAIVDLLADAASIVDSTPL